MFILGVSIVGDIYNRGCLIKGCLLYGIFIFGVVSIIFFFIIEVAYNRRQLCGAASIL